MNKKLSYCRLTLLILLCNSCNFYDKFSPEVETYKLALNRGDAGEAWEKIAPAVLYKLYLDSNRGKKFYEVVQDKHTYILNYYPEQQLLTLASHKSSGWEDQFKEVTLEKLKKLSESDLPFMQYDSILTPNRPLQLDIIKTNSNTKLLN